MEDTVKKLTKEQYQTWWIKVLEMRIARSKTSEAEDRHQMMQKDIEISRLRAAIFKQNSQTFKEQEELKVKEYQDYKKQLEIEYAMDISNCSFDEVTYEIKKLE